MPQSGPVYDQAASCESQHLNSLLNQRWVSENGSATRRYIPWGWKNMFGWKSKTNTLPRRMMEQTGAYDGGLNAITNGLMVGTRIATTMGWRQVEAIAVGDAVLTFDNGMQLVTDISRFTAWVDAPWTPSHMWPVHIPAGALGNYVDMTVFADQGLMIESDAALDQHGDPFAVVPALALVGVRGITRQAPPQQIEIITLSFDAEQVIYAEGSVLMHCPLQKLSLNAMLEGTEGDYDVLSLSDAAFLAECLVFEDHLVGNGYAA